MEKLKNIIIEEIEAIGYYKYDLKITLIPTYHCNQDCWFCNEYNNDKNLKSWDKKDIDFIIEKLTNEIPEINNGKEIKNIWFYIYGGEPTLNKHWEYINYKIIEKFSKYNYEIFIQTQTNLSLSKDRLLKFASKINDIKPDNFKISVCSSYHVNKQKVFDFISKLYILQEYNLLDYIFINTDFINEEKFINEFHILANNFFNYIKLRFTEIDNINLKYHKDIYKNYKDKLKKINYLDSPKELKLSDSDLKILDFKYFINKYQYLKYFFEDEFNFKIKYKKEEYQDIEYQTIIINFAELMGNNLNRFKYYKCYAGGSNLIIDYNLNISWCQLISFNEKIKINLKDIKLKDYLNKPYKLCTVDYCSTDLEFKKIKVFKNKK